MINYQIKINELTCELTNPVRPRDVKFVQAVVTALDTVTDFSRQRWCAFNTPPGDGFINFEDLTEQIVVGWVENHEFYPVIQAELAAELAELANPTKLGLTPPWVITTATTATSTSTTETITTSTNYYNLQNEAYIRSLIYQVLDEIKDATI